MFLYGGEYPWWSECDGSLDLVEKQKNKISIPHRLHSQGGRSKNEVYLIEAS
jgi:hypothetical protein